jgi:hypothetical protein
VSTLFRSLLVILRTFSIVMLHERPMAINAPILNGIAAIAPFMFPFVNRFKVRHLLSLRYRGGHHGRQVVLLAVEKPRAQKPFHGQENPTIRRRYGLCRFE